MANTAQARKRSRQSEKRRQHNASLKSMCRTYIKKVITEIDAGKKSEVEATYKEAVQIIDRIASKGIIHKNKAARSKNRLCRRIKEIG